MARGNQRWGVFVHDPDGDMGDGVVLGAFKSAEAADGAAERIGRAGAKRADDPRVPAGYSGVDVECIVVPLWGGGTAATKVFEAVIN